MNVPAVSRSLPSRRSLAPFSRAARDPEWTTLNSWWLAGHKRDFTSVSFLLDRQGRVRGIHPGGRYAPGDAAYEAMRRGIEKLLVEPTSG